MEYGKKIAILRKSKGMTQEELGKVLSVTYQAVSKWERDESVPDFEMMSRIAKFFGVPLTYFTEEEGAEEESAPAAAAEAPAEPAPEKVGMCTHCGKMVTADDVAQMTPKILCKDCFERLEEEAARSRAEVEARNRRAKAKEIYEQRGHGADFTLFLSLAVGLALYIAMTFFFKKNESDSSGAGVMLFLLPLSAFGIVQALSSLIKEIRDTDVLEDGPEGYSMVVSLVAAGLFSAVSFACFLTLYISTKDTTYIIFLVISVLLSFTFICQYMWGGIIRTIFTAGGFTFKMPGFIFSLSIDSILWMIIVKFVLGILSILLFIITTIIIAIVAIFVSAITFIPTLIHKIVKDKLVEKD